MIYVKPQINQNMMVVDDFKTPLSLIGITWIKNKQKTFTINLPHKPDALTVLTEHST